MAKNIGTLGKYDQRRLWKLICIVNPCDLLFKNAQKSNLSLDNKNLKSEKISVKLTSGQGTIKTFLLLKRSQEYIEHGSKDKHQLTIKTRYQRQETQGLSRGD